MALVASPWARADPQATRNAAARRVVELLVSGPGDDARALQTSLRELLNRLALDLRVIQVETPDAALALRGPSSDVIARFAVDLRAADSVTVSMFDGSSRWRAPRTVTREGSRALQIEQTAYIIHVATESVLASAADASAGAGPAAVAPPAEPTANAPAAAVPAAIWSVNLATYALAGAMAQDTGAVFGGGVGGELASSQRWMPQLWALGAYHLPFGKDALPVELHAAVWSLRLVPTIALVETTRFALSVGMGGGLDAFALSPGASSSFARVDARRTDVSPVAQGFAMMRLWIKNGSSVFLAGDLDYDFKPRAYVMTTNRETTDLIRARRLRPSVLLGFTINLFQTGDP